MPYKISGTKSETSRIRYIRCFEEISRTPWEEKIMAPEGGPVKLPTWTVYPSKPCQGKKRGELSPAVFFLPWYIIARVLGLIDEDGYEIE